MGVILKILIVSNKKYMDYTKLLLHSLFTQQKDDVDIYLFHRELSDADTEDLQCLCTQYPFKRLFATRLTPELTSGLRETEKLPIETYFRIVALDLLPAELERILYLDVDMIVKKPLDALYETDLEGCAAAACPDIYGYVFGVTQQSERRLQMQHVNQYFNAGVMLFNLAWFRENKYAPEILDYIYENEALLLWEDQDALNAMLEGRVKLVPWHLYNCAPLTYICRKEDVDSGRLLPLYREELSEVDAHPEDFYEMTQAIYEEAHVIHYLGETKPQRTDRPPAGCYEIFDQAFREAKAKFLPDEAVKGRLIFMTGVYDKLDIFTYELIPAFRELGYETMEFDSRDMQKSLARLAEFIKQKVTAVITLNNLGYNMELVEGKNIWDELGIFCVNILMDHPFCHKAAFDASPRDAAVLCPDKNHMRYVQRFYPQIPITGFLAHAGKDLHIVPKPMEERSIDVIYAGGLSRPFADQMMPDFSQYAFDAKKIADLAYEDLIAHPQKTTEQAVEEALLRSRVQLSEAELCDFIEKVHYIDLLAVSYFREAAVRSLVEAGISVTLYGIGWEDCAWLSLPNVYFGGRISADAVVEQMQDAKIVLSTMTWFKDGTHDRVFNGMLAGAVALSDSSVYMKEEFCGDIDNPDAELVMFELDEIDALPRTVKELLANPKRMQQIADRGREKALLGHTWQVRARELHEDLLTLL